MVNVVARMEIKPGCMEKFLEVLMGNVPTVLAEDGCIRYEPCFDTNPETKEKFITILETWESAEKLQRHQQAPHMARFREQAKELRYGSVVNVLEAVKR